MLNKNANELVCLVASQLKWLQDTERGTSDWNDFLSWFMEKTAVVANYRSSSDQWKDSMQSLVDLSEQLATLVRSRRVPTIAS